MYMVTHELEVERANASGCHHGDGQTWSAFGGRQRCSGGRRRGFRSRAAEAASAAQLPH